MRRYFAVWIVCSLIFLIHYRFTGQAVYGDGIDYWAYLHSVYFDKDLDFSNEYRHIYNPTNNNSRIETLYETIHKTWKTDKGLTDNLHPPGTAILLAPFYILSDHVVRVLNFFGAHLARNGYSDTYQIICGLGAIGYVVAGLAFMERTLRIFQFEKKTSFLATVGMLLTSPLLYYSSIDVLNSHFASFFWVCAFWAIWLSPKYNTGLLAGLIAGMAILSRNQEFILIVPVLIRDHGLKLVTFFIGLLIALLPMFYTWSVLYQSIFHHTYLHTFIYKGIIGSLIHPINGLLTKTPLLLFLVFSIPLAWKKVVGSWKYLLLFGIIQMVIITIQGGWVAAAYGGRMYISSLPLFAALLANLIRIKSRVFVVLSLFAVLNVFSILNFGLFEKESGNMEGRGLENSTRYRLERLWTRQGSNL